MKTYNSREISEKLRRYGHFLEAEVARYEALSGVVDSDSDAYMRIAAELKEVREMALYLHDLKEPI